MGKIILRLDRVMADRKMSLNELSEHVGVSNVNLSKIKSAFMARWGGTVVCLHHFRYRSAPRRSGTIPMISGKFG